jgi:uncharacterized protein with HEPN domain
MFSEYEFGLNQMLQDAVIRRFEIIGEAAFKVSDDIKENHPNVEWKLMKAMRNKLIHEYFGVCAATIYRTSHINLPLLRDKLEAIVEGNVE